MISSAIRRTEKRKQFVRTFGKLCSAYGVNICSVNLIVKPLFLHRCTHHESISLRGNIRLPAGHLCRHPQHGRQLLLQRLPQRLWRAEVGLGGRAPHLHVRHQHLTPLPHVHHLLKQQDLVEMGWRGEVSGGFSQTQVGGGGDRAMLVKDNRCRCEEDGTGVRVISCQSIVSG